MAARTAAVHARAWKQLFDGPLAARAGDAPITPFRLPEDHTGHLDGKPRDDGVRSWSRPTSICPWGDPRDPPGAPKICGLGNRKDELFAR
jgi:hypothetical protein